MSQDEDRRGPRRKVVRQSKEGPHGDSSWFIELECGHILARPRKAPAKSISCKACLGHERENLVDLAHEDDFYDSEVGASRLDSIQAQIAAKLGVPLDNVEAMPGFVRVVFEGGQIKALLESE